MVTFEIESKQNQRLVKIDLNNDAVRIEAGAMYYMLGNITMEAKAPSMGGIFKSMLTAESIIRPVYRGTGQLYLEPSFGEFTVLELSDEEWILDKGAYYASEMSISVDVVTNKAFAGMFSGEGFFQTKVSGTGKVIICSRGPIEMLELKNDKLVVDGSFAVARTGKLDFRVEKATKGFFSTALSGEGIVNTFTGTGKVLIAPLPYHHAYIESQFAVVHRTITANQSK